MFNPTRSQARAFLFEAWAKYRENAPLTDLERTTVEIIALHPEYHSLLEAKAPSADRDFPPEAGQINPYLHLSLHLGIAEQLATDRPSGVRAEYERLARKHVDAHDALHDLLECLGDAMWQSQRSGTPPDTAAYLDCLRRK
ncbi:MAG: DUF1841 family protein [Betaproteobacteria bacterium]